METKAAKYLNPGQKIHQSGEQIYKPRLTQSLLLDDLYFAFLKAHIDLTHLKTVDLITQRILDRKCVNYDNQGSLKNYNSKMLFISLQKNKTDLS